MFFSLEFCFLINFIILSMLSFHLFLTDPRHCHKIEKKSHDALELNAVFLFSAQRHHGMTYQPCAIHDI